MRVVTVMHEREVTVCVFIGCAIRGSAEKWQIHTQWSHFLRLAVTVDFDDISLEKYGQLISPQSERSEQGAFYLCPGVVSGYCDACESGYCYE